MRRQNGLITRLGWIVLSILFTGSIYAGDERSLTSVGATGEETCGTAIQQKHFSASSHYRSVYDRFLRVYRFHRELRQMHADAQVPGQVYLDATGGTGLVAQTVLQRFPDATVHNVDNSEAMLEVARKKNIRGLQSHHCDLMDLKLFGEPIASDSIDGITWNNGMYFFTPEQILQIFGEFYRVLKPGSRVSIASIRDLSEAEQKAFKKKGMRELLKMIATFRLSPFALPPILQSTKEIAFNDNQLTKTEGATVAAWGRSVGFKVHQVVESTYGGMDFFVVLEKEKD